MQDSQIRKLLKAGKQRFLSAEILFRNDRFLDAMYLAGYAPECALKALLLTNVPVGQRKSFVADRFRSAKAHDFEYLKALLKDRGINIPVPVAEELVQIGTWSTDLRYETGLGSIREAESFLRAAKTVVEWAEGRL